MSGSGAAGCCCGPCPTLAECTAECPQVVNWTFTNLHLSYHCAGLDKPSLELCGGPMTHTQHAHSPGNTCDYFGHMIGDPETEVCHLPQSQILWMTCNDLRCESLEGPEAWIFDLIIWAERLNPPDFCVILLLRYRKPSSICPMGGYSFDKLVTCTPNHPDCIDECVAGGEPHPCLIIHNPGSLTIAPA